MREVVLEECFDDRVNMIAYKELNAMGITKIINELQRRDAIKGIEEPKLFRQIYSEMVKAENGNKREASKRFRKYIVKYYSKYFIDG